MSRICVYEEDGPKWVKPCMVMKSIAFAIGIHTSGKQNLSHDICATGIL